MNNIPKKIHYCWVGGNPKPQSVLYCIESWKKYCPDYEIIEWNETNYDFTKNKYMKQAYDAKKWGFVPDYARLDIIYEHGGIYLDTDVEIIRSFDELLSDECFFGFEDTGDGDFFVACGLGFGAKKENQLIKKLRDYYDNVSFLNEDESLNLTPAPKHNTPIFIEYGFDMNNSYQSINNNVVYPSEYFCPKIFKTGKTKITKKTFSIHHFSASWMDDQIRAEIAHNQAICIRFGDKLGHMILLLESIWKKYGLFGSMKKILIQFYETLYLYYPIFSSKIRRIIKGEENTGADVLFDTSLNTHNMGDHIIMENCEKQLNGIIDFDTVTRVTTHTVPVDTDACKGSKKILCGTNIMSCNMRKYGRWKLPRNLENYSDIILMGVGFDSYNMKSDLYTRLLLRLILSSTKYHSVRDSFAENAMKSMGFNNVLNTGCPTMWGLTPEKCAQIPVHKSDNVVCTLTDYNKDEKNDKAMLDILLESYKKVYFWLQGKEDLTYIKQLGYADKLILVDSDLSSYDAVLSEENMDYVGTRLHAGIRALNKGRRSLIISIDNRAECIGVDTGLPVIKREDIPFLLKDKVYGEIVTDITMPWDNIKTWKEQFNNN